MKVCVFGAAGFFGQRIVERLLNHGHEVIASVRSPEKGAALSRMGASVRLGDLKNREDVREAIDGTEIVINAAVPHYLGRLTIRRAHGLAEEFMRNVRNVVEAAQRAGNIPVILSEGTMIWGDSGDGWLDETSAFNPLGMGRIGTFATPYAMEMIGNGAPIVRIVSGITYGAGSWFEHVVCPSIRRGLCRTFGAGENLWSLAHVDDVAEAYCLAVERRPFGETFAIVDDHPVRFRDFCNLVARGMGKPPVKSIPVWLGRMLAGQVIAEELTMNSRVSNARAKERLGWRPKYPSYEQGIPAVLREIQDGGSHQAAHSAH